jgi:hypothetical protein
MKQGKQLSPKPLSYLAEEALKKAVAEAIAEHRRNGVPIAVWRNGKVVRIAADQIEVREQQAAYTISRKRVR